VIAADSVIASSLIVTTSMPAALAASLILAHRDEIGAEPARFEQFHDDQRGCDERQDDPVERHAALELERLGAQIELDQRADACAGDRRNACKDAQYLGEGERDQREV